MASDSDLRKRLGAPKQIGVVVRDARKTADILSRLLGLGPFRFVDWPSDRPDMISFHRGNEGEFRLLEAFAQFGNIEIELIETVEGECGYSEYLREHGEGLHHLLFEVDDLDDTVSVFREMGIEPVFGGTGNRPGTRWLQLDTVPILGWSIELRNSLP
jgi:methylmalonyl-CoA/ethylmalonyl-CoA epimerase